MKNLKIKDFIFWNPSQIKRISPIKKATNKYGKEVYFYCINNANLEIFKSEVFNPDFKDKKIDDLKWLLNRYAVTIVNKSYLLNNFLNKDTYHWLNPENWTKTNVIKNS